MNYKETTKLLYRFKNLKREKGYLYFVKSDEEGYLEVWKAKMERGARGRNKNGKN